MLERQELHCHNCSNYVQFDIDTELDGNHVLTCPVCQHEHCRVVTKGKISDARWDQRNEVWVTNTMSSTSYNVSNINNYTVTNITSSSSTMYHGRYTSVHMYQSWTNARGC